MLAFLDEFTLILVLLACLWLTHDNAGGTEPYAKAIAVCYAIAGCFKGAAAFLGHVDSVADIYPWFAVLGRLALGISMVLVAIRLHILRSRYVLVAKEDDPAKAG